MASKWPKIPENWSLKSRDFWFKMHFRPFWIDSSQKIFFRFFWDFWPPKKSQKSPKLPKMGQKKFFLEIFFASYPLIFWYTCSFGARKDATRTENPINLPQPSISPARTEKFQSLRSFQYHRYKPPSLYHLQHCRNTIHNFGVEIDYFHGMFGHLIARFHLTQTSFGHEVDGVS